MKTFVLLHSAFLNASTWDSIQQKLSDKGFKVLAVELPGHGSDKANFTNITMDTYRDAVISVIEKLDEKVILLGHSMSGMVASAVAEAIPDKIEKLVYLAAFVPANGEALIDLSKHNTTIVNESMIASNDGLTMDIKQTAVLDIFFNGDERFQQFIDDNYQAEPTIPLTNAVSLSAENFGRVPKAYIHTLNDQSIAYNLQQQMAEVAGIEELYSIHSGHAPNISAVDELFNILLEVAGNTVA
ncbi:MAG: alpha/beta hydrolase [Mucilaginibacter sp.]|uniref:alpha/beta fold hydrolase n=1 Tax=Mucilaginibacter sp. TaxID=1882438 RepID=UPI0031A77F9E